MTIAFIENGQPSGLKRRRTLIVACGFGLLGLMQTAASAMDSRHAGGRHHPAHARQSTSATNTGPAIDAHGESVGIASFYGVGDSRTTASGEKFNPHALTAAHRTLPLGSEVKVTNLANGKAVVVRINDRGPFTHHRVIDLSRSAAEALGFIQSGLTKVRIETI